MFPHIYRFPLRSHREFFSNARHIRTQHLFCYVAEGDLSEKSDGAISVPAKNIPLASQRNTVKRRLRSALVPYLQNIQGKHIVLVYRAMKVLSQKALGDELCELFSKMRH